MNDFIGKVFKQNCNDSLIVLNETKKEKNKTYYKCKFIEHPYELFAIKDNIIRGKVSNPQIEIDELLSKNWPQHCGDSLKILGKTQEKKNGAYLWKCQFLKHPCIVLARKACIIKGQVLNPQIEKDDFIGQTFKQNYGNLKVLEKKDIVDEKRKRYKYICQFEGYEEKVEAFKDKIERGVVDNPFLIWRVKDKLEKYILTHYDYKPTLVELSKDLNVSRQQLGQNIISFDLEKLINYSFKESENNLREEIEKFIPTKIYEDNKYEIDIYIPNFNLGIEYNGNYWHSNDRKLNNYHQDKSLYFKEKGIKLIHVFEYEWIYKKDIILSIIKNCCGIFDKQIGARKCQIKEISTQEYNDFCNTNHLQGKAGARVKLGLFYKEELIQIMSFGSPRFTAKYQWEIIRECSKLNWRVLGGKEKLFKYFLKKYNPDSILSYCDFSKFDGKSYLKLNFEQKSLNKPGFVWYDKKRNEIFWRNPYKNKEMKDMNYLKIYDCGQLVFIWKKPFC